MTFRFPFAVVAATAVLTGLPAAAQARKLIAAPARPGDLVVQADAVVLGKVVEIDKDEVVATPFPGAPKEQAIAYKVAVLKVGETLAGGGLTQYRVGFPANATPLPAGPGRVRRPALDPVALTAGQEGGFLLVRHHEADFFVLVPGSKPLDKTDKAYETEIAEVKKSAKVLEDPVAALKAKDLADRFWAGYVLLQKYAQAKPTKDGKLPSRVPVSAEECKLLVKLMAELPWQPAAPVGPLSRGPGQPPNRAALWAFVNQDELRFKPPKAKPFQPGDPPFDFNKALDVATAEFLKADNIVLKRYALEK
jgi:hypothetical protein